MNVDIAEMNLLCAQDLPGAQNIDVKKCLNDLDKWASWTKHETDRHLYRLQTSPGQYHNSEAHFRVCLLTQVLGEDYRIRYNKELVKSGTMADVSSLRFFQDYCDLFIHGLLSAKRSGSCSSMPVLVTAVGRRLGYPMKLVCSKAHLFCRWDDGKDKVNVESQGEGFNNYPDDYYLKWPFPLTSKEIQNGFYLKSLTPAEELAVFLELRGMCFLQNKQYDEAILAFEKSLQLMPTSPEGHKMLMQARRISAKQQ